MYNSSLLIDSHFSMLQSYQRMFEFKISNTFEIIYNQKKKEKKKNTKWSLNYFTQSGNWQHNQKFEM